MILELTCYEHRSDPIPFCVEVQEHALEHLMADALEAYRLYELMSIRRPGDLWKYLWIKAIDVPGAVADQMRWKREKEYSQGLCPWPEDCMPLTSFDSLFYWSWDDTTPESSCWLSERQGKKFREFGVGLFLKIQEFQNEILRSDDLLVVAELKSIASVKHYHDFDGQTPFKLTDPDYQSPTIPKRSAAYYAKLNELLAMPEVLSVGVRGDEDYQTLRMLCTEQRRRSLATGQPVGFDMPIHVLSDGFPSFGRWGANVMLWQEGLGFSDLMLDGECGVCSLAGLIRMSRRQQLALTHLISGEVEFYEHTSGDGWWFYRDTRSDFDYAVMSDRWRLQFMK